MKKVLTAVLSFLMVISLSGCFMIEERTTKPRVTENVTDKPIDYKSIEDRIYSEIYDKIENELYDKIYEEIKKEYLDGNVSFDELQQIIYKVVDECKSGNVGISNMKFNSSNELVTYATGSGVIFDTEQIEKDGETLNRYYVITNEHVVDKGDAFRAVFADESYVTSILVGKDATTDIAVLYFDTPNTYTVNKLGSSEETKVGEFVLAIGNPKGQSLYGSVTFGVIGGKNRNLLDGDSATNTINEYLQHDAAINSGNSGGGLYNLNGECVGINSVKYASSDIEGLNFAIPIDLVKNVVSEIREYGSYSGTVSFGITVSPVSGLTKAGREQYNVPDEITTGVVVITVNEDGSAYGAMMSGDIILEIDGKTINESKDISAILKSKRIGNTVTIKVLREGAEVTSSVTFKRTISE